MSDPLVSANRRAFLKTVAAAGAVRPAEAQASAVPAQAGSATEILNAAKEQIHYPRTFSGRQLQMLAFPLGGIAAGSISLGGRGQLRDWEIFNKPDKGRSPAYAFPSIWCGKVTRVLEARILPPYEGSSGLGAANVPG